MRVPYCAPGRLESSPPHVPTAHLASPAATTHLGVALAQAPLPCSSTPLLLLLVCLCKQFCRILHYTVGLDGWRGMDYTAASQGACYYRVLASSMRKRDDANKQQLLGIEKGAAARRRGRRLPHGAKSEGGAPRGKRVTGGCAKQNSAKHTASSGSRSVCVARAARVGAHVRCGMAGSPNSDSASAPCGAEGSSGRSVSYVSVRVFCVYK